MKKDLLFVIPGLSAGGGEKSLVNLLNEIDYEQFNVDLFLFNHSGIFMKLLPEEVNIIPIPEKYKLFSLSLLKSIFKLIKKGNIPLACSRLMFALKNLSKGNASVKEQHTWKYMSKAFDPFEKKYDFAIGFLEKTSNYFIIDKIDAKRKIGWIHIDYDKLGMDAEFDKPYFSKLDNIMTVSEECANVLKKRFPDEKHKISVMYNIVSPAIINKLALENLDIQKTNEKEVMLLSVGRLNYQKGFEMAVEACGRLVKKGYNIKWYVIGEGEERKNLEKLINENGVQYNFILLGLKLNPYKYIKQADIYVQPSRFEGKSIAIDEAKILCKPIVTTAFSTAADQITDRVDGIIVEISSKGIELGIEMLIKNKDIGDRLVRNLYEQRFSSTTSEIHKLYRLFEG